MRYLLSAEIGKGSHRYLVLTRPMYPYGRRIRRITTKSDIGNRAISTFTGQKSSSRIILIIQSFLESRGNKFKVQRNCANTGNFSLTVSFHQYLQVLNMNCNICFRHLVLLQIFYFEKIFKTVA